MSTDVSDAGALAPDENNGAGELLEVRLPNDTAVAQDEEWCEVRHDGTTERIRFHDYARIYSIPGLYELLFYDMLGCTSPQVVASLLSEQLAREEVDPAEVAVLDLGAGNGMVGEALEAIGIQWLTGVDLIEEARLAAERDRPDLYDDYLVLDMAAMPAATRTDLAGRGLNCLAIVAALGFGDIPPAVFLAAYELIAPSGWIAFNIKKDFLDGADGSGFSRLLRKMFEDGDMEELGRREYPHRLSANGEALAYVAIVARKRRDHDAGPAGRPGDGA